jgi:hypothetical protein
MRTHLSISLGWLLTVDQRCLDCLRPSAFSYVDERNSSSITSIRCHISDTGSVTLPTSLPRAARLDHTHAEETGKVHRVQLLTLEDLALVAVVRREDRSRIGPARGQVQQVLTPVGVETASTTCVAATTNWLPMSIPGIGSRLPSPSWHSPSDLGATGGDAMRRSHQSNRTLCNSFHYCDR